MVICDNMLYILETDNNKMSERYPNFLFAQDPDMPGNLSGLLPDDLVTPPRSPITPNPPVTPNPEEEQMDSIPRYLV